MSSDNGERGVLQVINISLKECLSRPDLMQGIIILLKLRLSCIDPCKVCKCLVHVKIVKNIPDKEHFVENFQSRVNYSYAWPTVTTG